MARLRDDFGRAMKMFGAWARPDWGGFMVTHAYMGPLPAFFYPVAQLMDYGVHGWDVREGLDMPHFLSADAADLLVPFMFVLWQATTDVSRLGGKQPRGWRFASPGEMLVLSGCGATTREWATSLAPGTICPL